MSSLVLGEGDRLRRAGGHPYHGAAAAGDPGAAAERVRQANRDRGPMNGEHIEVDYYFEVENEGEPMDGLASAAKMVLEHGTLKPWHGEGRADFRKPDFYDGNMSWLTNLRLLGFNGPEKMESGFVTIAYPLAFFDKSPGRFPLSRLMMAVASEPSTAFSFYHGAKVVDIRLPDCFAGRFPERTWPNARLLDYLRLSEDEPVIGTIVKPKTGLTPELFSRCVVEAALAGARFTKADENLHLTLEEMPVYVGRVVKDLADAGFDLGRPDEKPCGKRFLFAPHITAEPDEMMAYAQAAVTAGANALMFSPYYGGGFPLMHEISSRFDVPVYAHTAGMNTVTGAHNWGFDPSLMYRLAAYYGAAFMQLTAVNGYLKPDDAEKSYIMEKLERDGLIGREGMTLVIAGGLGASNIGANMKALGCKNRMFLAGTSVYSHPGGPSAGVRAILLAHRAFMEKGITEKDELAAFGRELGSDGEALVKALEEVKQ